MKALQFVGDNRAAVSELDIPDIADDEVLLASRRIGICHSDIELLAGRYIIPFRFPVIPGHEWSAEVVRTGRAVKHLGVGARVVGECVIGTDHFGFSISGAAAEFFVAKESWLHELPDNLSWTQGALVEPFSCGYYATVRADDVDASDTVLVLGAGPIGLGIVAAAAGKGARVLVAEPSRPRAALAIAIGADATLDPVDPGFLEEVAALTGGAGASVVFEASGRPEAMAIALEAAAFRARLVYVGIDVGSSAPAKLGLFQSKELQARGIIGSPGVWPRTLRFLARSGVDLAPLVTSTYPLAKADDAVAAVLGDKSQVKVHLTSSATL
ncbi:zinc-binding dehydrogenase [Actinoplanes sp. TBRC 11911]|uniref:zinc-dependent alcohol dehydrogenase n=1 Tax=Actinoplanes sp. TBRC 11911 TaxID=2729386 RepID=UPI00145EF81B|nr:zinc-binding dehydrogenase [Actinoplanes sp. TBRC 11911]NMO56438.1 zinc-binding dehydrogenase [Actinoplanes sp. TBRC 11911]